MSASSPKSCLPSSPSPSVGCSFTNAKAAFIVCVACLISTVILTNFVVIPVLSQMFLYTLPIIYIGSHLSLRQAEVDPTTGEKPNKSESMNHRDAMMFPVFGSCALLSLYIAYKWLDPWYVNTLLTTYLTCVGVVALAETICTFTLPFVPSCALDEILNLKLKFWPFGTPTDALEVSCNWHYVFAYSTSIGAGLAWTITKHWALHNAFAIAFCIQAISLVALGNFKVASLLLSGLFVYDIFWVFGTEVMVTVAKSFEGPAKIIFPVSFDPWEQSILGLGDVVIPGVFISMCLRFDNYMHERALQASAKKNEEAEDDRNGSSKGNATSTVKNLNEVDIHQKFGKFYFWVVLISYELGLLTTGVVMLVFKHPQPALLYLVPYCIISTFGAAILNGEVKDLLAYQEEDGKPLTDSLEAQSAATEEAPSLCSYLGKIFNCCSSKVKADEANPTNVVNSSDNNSNSSSSDNVDVGTCNGNLQKREINRNAEAD